MDLWEVGCIEMTGDVRTGRAIIVDSCDTIEGLTFKNRVSYIKDGRTATLQMLNFTYFFNKYKY
jgi:hypothetical protein